MRSTLPPPPTADLSLLTIRGTITAGGREFEQVQYATSRYVVTEISGQLSVYLQRHRRRYAVNVARECLTLITSSSAEVDTARLRQMLGMIDVDVTPTSERRSGYSCVCHRFSNQSRGIVLSGEVWVATEPRLGATCIDAERRLAAAEQPFSLELASTDLVVDSTMRTLAMNYEQNYGYRLESVIAEEASPDRIEAICSLPIR